MKNYIINYCKYVAMSFVLIIVLQYALLFAGVPTANIQNISDVIILAFPVAGVVLTAITDRRKAKNQTETDATNW